jgi:hypothetical protein
LLNPKVARVANNVTNSCVDVSGVSTSSSIRSGSDAGDNAGGVGERDKEVWR